MLQPDDILELIDILKEEAETKGHVSSRIISKMPYHTYVEIRPRIGQWKDSIDDITRGQAAVTTQTVAAVDTEEREVEVYISWLG